jgi:hypothetical protein
LVASHSDLLVEAKYKTYGRGSKEIVIHFNASRGQASRSRCERFVLHSQDKKTRLKTRCRASHAVLNSVAGKLTHHKEFSWNVAILFD